MVIGFGKEDWVQDLIVTKEKWGGGFRFRCEKL
jgi:hypothetical protein